MNPASKQQWQFHHNLNICWNSLTYHESKIQGFAPLCNNSKRTNSGGWLKHLTKA